MKRLPTEEEKKLWEKIAREVKPLPPPLRERSPKQSSPIVRPIQMPRIGIATPSSAAYDDRVKTAGVYASIDHRTADRLRKGQYPIHARLDLHGMSRDRAWQTLHRFLLSHYEDGHRCLLIITGKGEVLRESLPSWLAAHDLAPVVLAFDIAQPKHGGSGAYYVLLRRKRTA